MNRTNSYYDIDDILCGEEQFPCIFMINAIDLGYLDTSSPDDNHDINAGEDVDLPLWLCTMMAEQNLVKIQRSKHYSDKFLAHLLADPSVVNNQIAFILYADVGRWFLKISLKVGS